MRRPDKGVMDWLFKAGLTAAMVLLVMAVARRSGRRWAGVAAALPTITAPTLAWLVYERGAAFAVSAAIASVSACACAMLAVFSVGYALDSGHDVACSGRVGTAEQHDERLPARRAAMSRSRTHDVNRRATAGREVSDVSEGTARSEQNDLAHSHSHCIRTRPVTVPGAAGNRERRHVASSVGTSQQLAQSQVQLFCPPSTQRCADSCR